ncbi:integral membrane protein [Catenulispora acidiphila DSM 44928]|uniref:Integral membrane protein n=1 Tax=Catenulispora acidiphila (strain DSM 44928 / JCM 14897 / NBRC 102108 / NRRL B-24433 / ID139908) TaxID=479433 RepID=C7QJJ3_CATAD|nr:DUF3099 domain-containing protein [Catenulispora acidiphila]ACU71216.1 integral membrane protein [Catenulispora acidiphila DSM 44928]
MRIGRDKRGHQDVVFGLTDAPKPLSQDIRSRESKYLMAMGIRVAAFLLIVLLPIDWPWKLGLAALALVLPYVAVVYANGGREPQPGADSPFTIAEQRALLPGQGGQSGGKTGPDQGGKPGAGDAGGPEEPLSGRIVGDDD